MNPLKQESKLDSSAAILVEELIDKLQAGDMDIEAFIAAHSEQAETLRRLLPALRVMAGLSNSQGDENCFFEQGLTGLGELGDFRIVREVGRGGMGIVYEAAQLSLGRRVALKILPFAATIDPRQLQRFLNEARSAASLEHPHIVPVYGVGCDRGVHYYAMKFIDGQSLVGLIQKQRANLPGAGQQSSHAYPDQTPSPPVSPSSVTAPLAAARTEPAPRDAAAFRQIAQWGIEAAEALEYAHNLGIVHRDIKPANLLIDGHGALWITDFGLARTTADAGLTMTGDVLGTLRYMSPEQALAKHGLVDHRTDIYALGATLYELLTLHPAVDGKDREEILRKITFDEPLPPGHIDHAIPTDLETIILKALAKEPAERYGTAKEVADDLHRILEDKPIHARRAGFLQRGGKWMRRRKSMVAAVIGAGLLALGFCFSALLWHNGQLREAAQREHALAEQTRRERDLAEEERRWVRQAADDLYTQVADKWLSRQPRLEPVQRELLEKALRFYQHLAQQGDADPSLRYATAQAHYRLASIHLKLGRHEEAASYLRKGITRFDELVAEFPGKPSYLQDLSSSYRVLGNVLRATGRPEEAGQAYKECMDRCKKLVADFPARPEYQRHLAEARQDLALVLADTAKTPDAEKAYHEAEDTLQKLINAFPNQTENRAALATVHSNLGLLLYNTGRAKEAEPVYREAIAALQKLALDHPAEPEYRERWALNLGNLAAVMRSNRTQEAVALLRQAVALQERLTGDSPDVPDYQWELASSHNNLGVMSRRLRDFAGAEESYCRAIAMYRKLIARFPAVPTYREHLGSNERNLGNILGENLDRPKEAEEAYGRALETQRKLASDFPAVPTYRRDLANTYDNLAALQRRTSEVRGAEESLSQSLKLWEDLAAAAAGNTGYLGGLARASDNLALVLVWDQGPPCPQAAQAIALAVRAAELEPKVSNHWLVLGVAHYRAGSFKDSLAALQHARELGSPVEAGGWFAAMALWQLGNKEEAGRAYAEALQRMEMNQPQNQQFLRFRAEAAQLLGIEE